MDRIRGDEPATGVPGEPELAAAAEPADVEQPEADGATPLFDRHLVLEQLGGWRGMVDAALPTIAFIVANSQGGLRVGIYAALSAAVLVFLLRLVRRQSVQQAVSGLFAVGIAVAIAAASGQARDFFVLGIVRNAAIGLVVLASIAFRRPLVGVVAEFLAPSHLGSMASASLPGLRKRIDSVRAHLHHERPPAPARGEPDPEPELHWREDPRMMRAYTWLTVMWGGVFLLRAAVQAPFYYADEVEWLGTVSLLLGLPVTAIEVVVTLWVVSRLHRHRCAGARG
ncbi:DUF3159 domain-containing protein [Blastococcus sp. PRF04-17]|uniref:DUF3159 domain-containing protein n=1 Tax=Blastococcus sp. PRF04-17 TaxID=2933797 RepID=UPI001FF45F80|nr:DUF3159 domain-containing protein [Blastococcus sp. PRF04-17]UOY02043.1 DUF3159 domain-containing protein [Blastococcus sp. PRF04-17]